MVVVVGAILSCAVSMGADAPGKLLERQDIRIRDPFIYADSKTRTYYLYAQSANRPKSGFLGVEAYTSKDLENWNPPQPVLTLPNDAGKVLRWQFRFFHESPSSW